MSQDLPEAVLAVADRLREDDHYHVASELYRWLLDQRESADAHFGLGQCLGKMYDYEGALSHLDLAFAQDPQRSAGASYFAYILERHGRMEEADRLYRRALEGAEADDEWARSHYAWFLEKWGRIEEARAAYDDMLARNPAHTWTIKRYALMLRRLGEEERARAMLAEAAPRSLFAALNYLEYLLLAEDDGYPAYRASLDSAAGPAWYPVLLDLFDYYREHLLPSRPDPRKLAAWEAAAARLTDSVHRDFDDLTALLEQRGGDVATWRRLIGLLLK